MTRKVCVLGCGPAGMMVAHAATLRGCQVTIFSQYKPSVIGGAQYLHQAIPEATGDEPDGVVELVKLGTRRRYAERVYGDPDAPTSWDDYSAGEHKVWNMRRAYSWLWYKYESRIVDVTVTPDKLARLGRGYFAILSTIPRHVFCTKPEEHTYTSQNVWITDDDIVADNTIVMNGEEGPWYRACKIFETPGVEWPSPQAGAVKVIKPLRTDCDCHQSVLKFGRYGLWRKGVLIHDAFNEAYGALA